jgi:site-specific recombinase XerD
MLQAGANIKEVQAAVGHDRIGSTMVYLHTAEGAAQRGQATLEKALAATEKPELKIIEGGK